MPREDSSRTRSLFLNPGTPTASDVGTANTSAATAAAASAAAAAADSAAEVGAGRGAEEGGRRFLAWPPPAGAAGGATARSRLPMVGRMDGWGRVRCVPAALVGRGRGSADG